MQLSFLVVICAFFFAYSIGVCQTPDVIEVVEEIDDSPEARKEDRERLARIQAKLRKSDSIDRRIDAELKDVLEFISDKSDLPLIVDPSAFDDFFGREYCVESRRIALRPSRDLSIHKMLDVVLGQVGACYEIRRDYIEITPCPTWVMRTWRRLGLPTPIPAGTTKLGQGLLNLRRMPPPPAPDSKEVRSGGDQ